jgi:hypothetical protein
VGRGRRASPRDGLPRNRGRYWNLDGQRGGGEREGRDSRSRSADLRLMSEKGGRSFVLFALHLPRVIVYFDFNWLPRLADFF